MSEQEQKNTINIPTGETESKINIPIADPVIVKFEQQKSNHTPLLHTGIMTLILVCFKLTNTGSWATMNWIYVFSPIIIFGLMQIIKSFVELQYALKKKLGQ
jgi:hypothetical protein